MINGAQKFNDNAEQFDTLMVEMLAENKELLLMVDVFNSAIVTKVMPGINSPCHTKILELLASAGKQPTATA